MKGEYRTSVIVDPADGRMPLTQAGVDLSARIAVRNAQEFDHPEQRPLLERCMQSYGAPPIIQGGVLGAPQIVQTRDHVVIVTEGPVGGHIIHLGGQPPPDALRTVQGYSTGRWEGDTLVVQTTHRRDEDPAHFAVPRPLLLSRHSRITERFTRVSETELFYQFTIEDGELYTRPWVGEFSFRRHDGPILRVLLSRGQLQPAEHPPWRTGGSGTARRAETEPGLSSQVLLTPTLSAVG